LHDKQIRRRRAVLVLLVAVSLILLTDYFGESSNSPLHSVQRGIATVLEPVQSVASTIVSPVRDVAGYVSSTFNAKSQVAHYKSANQKLVRELANAQYNASQYKKAAQILRVDRSYGLGAYGPETANVIGQDPVLYYKTITVDKGTNAGVKQFDPVVGPGGLVGDVSTVTRDESVVSLVTSPKFSVGAEIENNTGAAGLIQPQLGNPTTLTLINVPTNSSSSIAPDQLVVTSGFKDPNDPTIESYAPAGIPIGTVSSSNPQNSVLTNQDVQVTPLADLQHLSLVQILTHPHNG
jgi:rod shape-determining protein MreC